MTISDYITNPAGKGSSVLLNSEVTKSLNEEFEIIKDKLTHRWFMRGNRFAICIVEIPSRSADGLFYDVVFEFDLLSVGPNTLTINDCVMKCFSNCPSFSYTYAYVFNQQNILCNWLTGKYDRKVFHKEPAVRNSYKMISYERSLYLSAKYLMSNERNKISSIKARSLDVTSYLQISTRIRKQSEIEDRYESIVKLKKDREHKKSESPKTTQTTHHSVEDKRFTPKTATTQKTSTVSKTKKTKRI